MPKRIQLRRTKGWRKPEGAVVVSRPSRWGNPYRWIDIPDTVSVDGELFTVADAERRRLAVVDFRAQVQYGIGQPRPYPSHAEIRNELAGKDLACWCPLPEPGEPDHCHAAVLIAIASGEAVRAEGERLMPDVDYPTVVNPEAIGDPDASPIVQLPPGAAALIRLPPPRDEA